MNIVGEIFSRADPAATALMAGARCVTFGQLEQWTEAACRALGPALGLGAGQRVALNCPNGIDHIAWSLAILQRGAALVPVATELSPRERDDQLGATASDTVLCAGGRSWHREAATSFALDVPGLGPATALRGFGVPPARFDEGALASLNPALIRFSSGTTGARKGVVLSHETLLERVTASNTHLGLGPGDRVIWVLPMAHHFAVSIILYLLHGATTVLETSHLGEGIFRALARAEGTALYASPFHYALLASCDAARAVPSLRLAVSTTAALPAETAQRFLDRFGIPLRQALGIIECGLPLLNDLWPLEKPSSVGRPQRGYEAALRDEQQREVRRGEVGELFLRGPGMVDACLVPWMTRKHILEDGWFRTGDLAREDADGALYLVGRTHAVINSGGMKCFPEEVEAVLRSHPAVAECRVRAAPHATFGSVPVAEIVVAAGAVGQPEPSELTNWCQAQLSAYKIPVKFAFVDAIPKTANGKLQR